MVDVNEPSRATTRESTAAVAVLDEPGDGDGNAALGRGDGDRAAAVVLDHELEAAVAAEASQRVGGYVGGVGQLGQVEAEPAGVGFGPEGVEVVDGGVHDDLSAVGVAVVDDVLTGQVDERFGHALVVTGQRGDVARGLPPLVEDALALAGQGGGHRHSTRSCGRC